MALWPSLRRPRRTKSQCTTARRASPPGSSSSKRIDTGQPSLDIGGEISRCAIRMDALSCASAPERGAKAGTPAATATAMPKIVPHRRHHVRLIVPLLPPGGPRSRPTGCAPSGYQDAPPPGRMLDKAPVRGGARPRPRGVEQVHGLFPHRALELPLQEHEQLVHLGAGARDRDLHAGRETEPPGKEELDSGDG